MRVHGTRTCVFVGNLTISNQTIMNKTKLFTRNGPLHIGVRGTSRILMGLTLAALVVLSPADAAAQQQPINLGSAGRFAVLAASDITSIPTSAIKGDVGLSPSARSRIAGLTQPEVTGSIFAASDGGATAVMLTQAHGDLTTAYNESAGRTPVPAGPFLNPGSGNIGGLTLVPGLYKFTGEAIISGSDLTLSGGPTDVWIFQIGSALTVANGIQVVLAGGAQASNIFWQVGTSAILGTTVRFKGTILADQSIALRTLATLDGRALARIGAVTLDSTTITVPSPNTNSVILVSSPAVTSSYSEASGQSVNLGTQTITVPRSGNRQFYRILSRQSLTIRSISTSGANVVITYN